MGLDRAASPPRRPLPLSPRPWGECAEPFPPIPQGKNTVLRAMDVRGKPPPSPSLPRDVNDDEDSDVDPTLYECWSDVLVERGIRRGMSKKRARGDGGAGGLAVGLS